MMWLKRNDDRLLLRLFKVYGRLYDPDVMRMMRMAFCMGCRKGARVSIRTIRDRALDCYEELLMNNEDDY